MAKAIFRHLRGELNGYYITNLYNTLNKSTEEIKLFLMNTKNMQFKNNFILDKDLYGIGKFAGISLPRVSIAESMTSLRMSNSCLVDNVEYSERGLLDEIVEKFNYYHLNLTEEGYFSFVHTSPDETTDINESALFNKRSSMVGDENIIGYVSDNVTDLFSSDGLIDKDKLLKTPPKNGAYNTIYGDQFSFLSEGDLTDLDYNIRIVLSDSYIVDDTEYSERGLYNPPAPDYPDINTLATEKERSSMVGNEAVLGYIPSSAQNVLDENGNINLDAILSEPPENEAYSEYYGDKFLYLAEGISVYTEVDSSLYIELYVALQTIRYNGASIESLCKIIELICPDGLVKIIDIKVGVDGKHINVYYEYDLDLETVNYKQQRISLLEYLVSEKFKQVLLIEKDI